MPYCSICQQTVSGWLPHPQKDQRSPLMTILDAVGSDLSIFSCPACRCNDRLRHLWLYMIASGVAERLKGANLLHIAPEIQLERMLEGCGLANYVRGDLHPTNPKHSRIDIEDLPFKDGTLDLILCNHVLEHVNDPIKALREMCRALRPGGILIAQTPYAPSIKKTFETHAQQDAATNKLLFGQEDHVRLFGSDITEYFHAAGFQGELLSHATLLPDVDAMAYGCNAREPFFVFWKPVEVSADPSPRQASQATPARQPSQASEALATP